MKKNENEFRGKEKWRKVQEVGYEIKSFDKNRERTKSLKERHPKEGIKVMESAGGTLSPRSLH